METILKTQKLKSQSTRNVKTSDLLNKLIRKEEVFISIAIETFQNLETEILMKPSANGGWNIAQCLDHLNSYGHFYLPQIEIALNKIKNTSVKETYTSGWLGAYFTKMMEPGSSKKYKAFKDHIPSEHLDAHKVVGEFIQQQELLLKYLEVAGKHDMNAIRVPISISSFVRLMLGDVFQFLIAHNERHIIQAKKNL